MNVSSDHIRSELKRFDTFFNKVSKRALLRDTGYSIHSPEDLDRMVVRTRVMMSYILKVDIENLAYIYEGNGRNDCDNYAISGCYILKMLHDAECRGQSRNEEKEYAIFPIASEDIDHSQSLCLTSNGWILVDFITGEIVSDFNIKILQVG